MSFENANMDRRLALVEASVERLDHSINGNGKPPLEDRIMTKVDSIKVSIFEALGKVERHTGKNLAEGDGLVMYEVRRLEEVQDKRHEENKTEAKALKKSVDRLTTIFTAVAIAATIIQVLERFGVIRVMSGR